MVILLPKYTVEVLKDEDMQWFVETAAVNMMVEEANRPDLVNIENMYTLASMGAIAGTAFVAKVDGVNAGVIGGVITPNMFNPTIKTLAEVFWYVLPEYRQSRVGAMLLKEFIAQEWKADEISMSLLASSKLKQESLIKKGFRLVEYNFIKRK